MQEPAPSATPIAEAEAPTLKPEIEEKLMKHFLPEGFSESESERAQEQLLLEAEKTQVLRLAADKQLADDGLAGVVNQSVTLQRQAKSEVMRAELINIGARYGLAYEQRTGNIVRLV